jgi:hypothetical protein
LSFALERIGPLAAITIIIFYLLVLYLFALTNTPENPFASIYSESLIKTACQHLLLLVGFDTLIYRKYYDTPLYFWIIRRLFLSLLNKEDNTPEKRSQGGAGGGGAIDTDDMEVE